MGKSETAALVAELHQIALDTGIPRITEAATIIERLDLANRFGNSELQDALQEIKQLTEIAAERTTAANELELRAERAEAVLREIKELSSEFEIVRMA